MATFFGEIIPSFSRAVDDDEDEYESDTIECTNVRWSPVVKAELQKNGGKKLPCQIMIVAIGPAASGFVQAYVLSHDYYVVGAIFSGLDDGEFNTFEQTSPTDKTCYIYRSRSIPDVFVCACKTTVSEEQCYSWVDQLFSSIDTSSPNFYLSILCSYMTSDYRGEISTCDMETPFLRSLKTNKFPGTPLCPYLEQPNLVSGLPAQLLTSAQMQDVKAVLYICYTDSIYLDSDTIRIFLPLLKSTPIKDVIAENPKAEEEMERVVNLYSIKNSMYL